MKTLHILSIALGIFFIFSCEKVNDFDQTEIDENTNVELSSRKRCYSSQILEKQMRENPDFAKQLSQLEELTKNFSESDLKTPNGIITIPVVVHVLYKKQRDNITRKQILSQIDVLNEDFRKANRDINKIPKPFANRAANSQIRFILKKVIRKKSTRNVWNAETENMKFSKLGGSNAVNPYKHLNIWVCPSIKFDGEFLLGYAQFPGFRPSTDGVVIETISFGRGGSALAPYNRGRTTTHEVGHWLNLRHIWGDGGCNKDDLVADTPRSNDPYFGCPKFPKKSCGSVDMTMNFMDYVDDRCMYMFTKGQKKRMRATFNGPRKFFVN